MRSFFKQLSIFFPFSKLNSKIGSNILIPLYHLVSNHPPLHVNNLYPVMDEKRFIMDLDFLLKHFAPISGSQLLDANQDRINLTKPSMLLTFDDGFSEIYQIVAPILLKKGVPAVFFVSQSFVGNNDLMFRCKLNLVYNQILSSHSTEFKFYLKSHGIDDVKDILKIDEPSQVIDNLANSIDVDFKNYLEQVKPYLTIDQLKELSKNGFIIGGHGINHLYYKNLTFDEQLNDVEECMAWLNGLNLGQPKFYAFPFTDVGVNRELFNAIFSKNIVDLSFGTAGIRRSRIHNHYQRLPMEANSTARKIVGGEILYYLAKQSLGLDKNQI